MPAFDALLFDLDGTLLDSVPLILESFQHSFTRCGLPVPSAEQLLKGVGIPLRPHFLRYFDDQALIDRLIEVYREYNHAHHDVRIQAFPGVQAMLADVRAARIPVGIVTSKNRRLTERGLSVAGLDSFVDAIVASDDVTNPKPHPEPVERALSLLAARADRAVFVGDSLHDLEAGRAAGVRTGAALWGPFTRSDLEPGAPDYWLSSPGGLPEVLGVQAGRG